MPKSKRLLSMLIHAASKTGKSTLLSTAPTPMLVIDAEGGWRFVRTRGFKGDPLRVIHWNPMTHLPPRWKDDWDVCVVTVTQWDQLLKTFVHMTQSPHDFKTIALDSITEIQRRCKQNISTDVMRIQDWGTLLTKMDSIIRGFRDLTMIPEISVEIVLFVAESRTEDGKIRPYMQGQISTSLPYWVDICGYLFVAMEDDPADPNGAGKRKVRKLQVGAHPQVESGERVQGTLPDTLTDPRITEMIEAIFGQEAKEATKK